MNFFINAPVCIHVINESNSEGQPGFESELFSDNGRRDEAISVVLENTEASNNTNSKQEILCSPQSEPADDYHLPPSDLGLNTFVSGQSLRIPSRETFIKQSHATSLSSNSSKAPAENFVNPAQFLGVFLRETRVESIPSEHDETRIKQSSLMLFHPDADVVATGVCEVNVTNAGSITTSQPVSCNVSEPVRNQVNVTTSSKVLVIGSVCPIPNEDTGNLRILCVTALDAVVQNSGSAHSLIPYVNESNNHDDSSLSSVNVINLKSSAELAADQLEAESRTNERGINTDSARPKTVNQLLSGSSDSFIMSNLTETEDAQNQMAEGQWVTKKAPEEKNNLAGVANANALNNSESATNTCLRIDEVRELRNDGNIKTQISVDQLASGSSESFMMVSDTYTECVYKEMAHGQRELNNEEKINDTGVIPLTNLNSSCDDSFVMSDGNVIDDTVVDGEECEDKVAVEERIVMNVCEVLTPSVVTSESIPAVKSVNRGFLSSAVKLFLSISLVVEECTNS